MGETETESESTSACVCLRHLQHRLVHFVVRGCAVLMAANDGTVPFRDNERILLSYVLTTRFFGDNIDIKVGCAKHEHAQSAVRMRVRWQNSVELG